MTLTSFLIIINNEKIKSSKKKFPVLYASWVSCILFWSHNTSYFLAGIFPCLLPLPYISFLPRASSCLFLHHPPLFFLLHSYHLHFHVNTWIKGRNRNEVKCFLLCGQDATSIKVTLMHCWSRSVSTANCFRVLTLKPLGPGQSTLEWGKGGKAFELGSSHWNHVQILGQPAVESWQPFWDWPRDLKPHVCHCLMVCFHGFILSHRSGKK